LADRQPRVALVTDAIGPFHRGGKEMLYRELSRRLAERADVHVYTMNWWRGPRIRQDGDVTYHAISPLLPLYSGNRRSIRQALMFGICCLRLVGEPFDVIQADHMPYIQLLSLKLVSLIRRRRLVVTWHELWGPDYWRTYLGRAGLIGWMFESLAMRLPDMIIAVTPQTATRLREHTGERLPVVVIPNGIDLESIRDLPEAADARDVVVVGRLLPHKRTDMLLDALAALRDQGRPVSARIIGTGPERATLAGRIDELGLSGLVEIREDIDGQNQLYAELKAARAAVFASEREGFGIAVLEALACGVPVITTSAPDNLARHLVERSDGAGVVCEPNAAALAGAIGSVLDRTAASAPVDRRWLAEYDWERITWRVAAALS
jgi:glycosyltransferase involved in cell wall biosynthesis